MIKLLSTCMFAFVATTVAAQTIHGHPQLAAYTDASQYPTVSGQAHWVPGNNPVQSPGDGVFDLAQGRLGNSTLAHTHLDLVKCPLYVELTGPIPCRFAVKLFHTTGQVFVNPAFQGGIRDIVWDETNSSTPPDMVGDPMGLKEWGGSLVIDPRAPSQFPTVHGWWVANFNAVTRYANHDTVDQELLAPFYVLLDRSVPETSGYPILSSRVSPHSTRHPEENWGTNIVETLRGTPQYLPLTPLSQGQLYTTVFATNGYGADGLPPALAERTMNIDLHNHNGGTVLQSITQPKVINIDATFDPAVLGAGSHKMAILRHQVGLSGTEAVNSLLVFDVAARPPTDVWETITPSLQQLRSSGVLQNRYRICTSLGCVETVK